MKYNRWKRLMALCLSVLLAIALLPASALAATTVSIGYTQLQEGHNYISGGTATLDTASRTLTLNNVVVTPDKLHIVTDGEFNVIVQGNCSFGREDLEVVNAAMSAEGCTALNVKIDAGATLSIYVISGSGIDNTDGSLNIYGPGTLKVDSTDAYSAIRGKYNVSLAEGLKAEITSSKYGIYSDKGSVFVENAAVTLNTEGIGIIAENYDDASHTDLNTSVVMRGSTVNINSSNGERGVLSGLGGIRVENTQLTTRLQCLDENSRAYTLYTTGDLVITGDQTVIDAVDDQGIYADKVLRIEGGQVNLQSYDRGLCGRNGVAVTGGMIDITTTLDSAILCTYGPISITGGATVVNATTQSATVAAIQNECKESLPQ